MKTNFLNKLMTGSMLVLFGILASSCGKDEPKKTGGSGGDEPQDVVVKFETYGGGTITNYIVEEEGDFVPLPKSPHKAGYAFDGWYKDAGFENEVDFTTARIFESFTAHAKYITDAENVTRYKASVDDNTKLDALTDKNFKYLTYPSAINGVTMVATVTNQNNGNAVPYTVRVPDSYTTIGQNTFRSNLGLRYVSMNAVTLEPHIFNGCTSLKEVDLGTRVTAIGDYSFTGTSMDYIYIPASCTSLTPKGNSAFNNAFVKKLEIGSGIATIGVKWLHQLQTEHVILPATVTKIENAGFAYVNWVPNPDTEVGGNICNGPFILELKHTNPEAITFGMAAPNDAFSGCEIHLVVPASAVAAYQASSKWDHERILTISAAE